MRPGTIYAPRPAKAGEGGPGLATTHMGGRGASLTLTWLSLTLTMKSDKGRMFHSLQTHAWLKVAHGFTCIKS
jgi:hypothetical protein